MKRRSFLATAAAASAAPAAEPERPIRSRHWGPQFYDSAEQQQLTEVVQSRNPFRWYAQNSKVLAFEKEFASRMGVKYAVGVTSGTAALQVAMAALEIGPGDEVILPSWTWHSCFNAVVLAGGLPVCAEIDESFGIDPEDIERHITPNTKAVMAIHLQGNPCRLDRVLEIARRHKLKVLEDCAQSVGGSFKGKPLGASGDIAIYSLQQNKTITSGEGGAVVTNDPVLFERAVRFHDMGMVRDAHTPGGAQLESFIGTNFRMNEFTGGVLLAQIRKIDRIIAGSRGNSERIYEGIRDIPGIKLRLRPDPAGDIGAFPAFSLGNKERRDRFLALMKADGLPAGGPGGSVVLPTVPHIMAKRTIHPAWPTYNSPRGKAIQYGPQTCPKTIDILNRFAGIPVDPKWTAKETDAIVAGIRKHYKTAMA